MSDIGIRLNADRLVLTRGRDFKWNFDNLDDSQPPQPIDFPSGELYFSLDTGGEHDAQQQVQILRSSGGAYGFSLDGHATGAIAFDEVTSSPEDATPSVTSALEALPNVGVGNVQVSPAQLFPVWEITLTLNSGNNEIQQLILTHVTGGNFKLGYGLEFTDVLAWNATPATVQTALEGLSGIGAGNISVTPLSNGYQFEFIGAKANTNVDQIIVSALGIDLSQPLFTYGITNDVPGAFPTAKTSTVLQGTSKFTDSMVNTLNTVVNNMFDSFDTLLGVDINYEVLDNLNTKLTVTSLKSYSESELITFAVDVTSNVIEGFLNSVAQFVGIFDTIHVDFYWNRIYQVEFVGACGLQAQPALVPDITDLTGLNDEQAVEVTVLNPGKARFDKWPFTIDGSSATIKIESEVADDIPEQTLWQLVFLPDGEAAGGDPVARGRVMVQQ